MNHDRRIIIGALIEQLHGLPLCKLRLLADAAEFWNVQHRRRRSRNKPRNQEAGAAEVMWAFGRSQTESNGRAMEDVG